MDPADKDRADIERIMSDEKKISLAAAARARIKQHAAGRNLANRRIEACMELMKRSPSLRDVLEPVIATWARIRSYHHLAMDNNTAVFRDLDVAEELLPKD